MKRLTATDFAAILAVFGVLLFIGNVMDAHDTITNMYWMVASIVIGKLDFGKKEE